MIKIEKTEVYGFETAIRGMRNPLNSWDKSDSRWVQLPHEKAAAEVRGDLGYIVGDNDLALMKKLSNAGNDHGKFLRMITVSCDITAPQFWWFEFDTYKVGTVRNSCSKMHKIHVKPFNYEDFSHEGIDEVAEGFPEVKTAFQTYIDMLEWMRVQFNNTQEKKYWRALIETLPEGYNMKATIYMNYQVLKTQYPSREFHKVNEWREYCKWVDSLPLAKEIILGE